MNISAKRSHHTHSVLCTIRRPSCDAPQVEVYRLPHGQHPFPSHRYPQYNVHTVRERPPVLLHDGLEVFVESIGVIQLQETTGKNNKGWVVYKCINPRMGYTEIWLVTRPKWVAGKLGGWISRQWEALTQIFSF